MSSHDRASAKSAERALELLVLLGGQREPVPAGMIQRSLGLPRSSMYTLLGVMEQRGFVVHHREDRRWSLGPTAISLGGVQTLREHLRRVARPVLQDLTARVGEVGLLGVGVEHQVEVVARVDPPGETLLGIPGPGWWLSAHLSAYGRAVLMCEPEERLRQLFPASTRLPVPHGRGPERRAELVALLAEHRAKGYAWDHAEIHRMSDSVAAPVFDHLDRPVASIGVTYWSASRPPEARAVVARQVSAAAARLSRRLGHGAEHLPALAQPAGG